MGPNVKWTSVYIVEEGDIISHDEVIRHGIVQGYTYDVRTHTQTAIILEGDAFVAVDIARLTKEDVI